MSPCEGNTNKESNTLNYTDKMMYSCAGCMPGNYYGAAEARRERKADSCGCGACAPKDHGERCCDQRGGFENSFALAMAYVPMQEWNGILAPAVGLQNGTVFGELVKPFCGAGRRKG